MFSQNLRNPMVWPSLEKQVGSGSEHLVCEEYRLNANGVNPWVMKLNIIVHTLGALLINPIDLLYSLSLNSVPAKLSIFDSNTSQATFDNAIIGFKLRVQEDHWYRLVYLLLLVLQMSRSPHQIPQLKWHGKFMWCTTKGTRNRGGLAYSTWG